MLTWDRTGITDDILQSIVDMQGVVTFYYNPVTDKTCVAIQALNVNVYYVITGHYSTDTGFTTYDI